MTRLRGGRPLSCCEADELHGKVRFMGADNWARCPRCYRQAKESFEAKAAKVSDSYGKVPVEEFDKSRAALAQERILIDGDNTYRTFREEYSFLGADRGVVTVSYSGSCGKCKLGLNFKEEHPIPDL